MNDTLTRDEVIEAQRQWGAGVVAADPDALLALYDFSELVFKRGEAEEGGAISEEMVSTLSTTPSTDAPRWAVGCSHVGAHRRAASARCSTRYCIRFGRWHTPVSPQQRSAPPVSPRL